MLIILSQQSLNMNRQDIFLFFFGQILFLQIVDFLAPATFYNTNQLRNFH